MADNNCFNCHFCNSKVPFIPATFVSRKCSFAYDDFSNSAFNSQYRLDKENNLIIDEVALQFFKCPNCLKIAVKIVGIGDQFANKEMFFYPDSHAKQYPDYIPQAIRDDYEEACKIVELSPKASATLSRRCLQGMIRDFWGITPKKNLAQEIDAITQQVAPQIKEVLHSVRQLGNIGAHMEQDVNLIVDIDANEATQLIKLIELLMKNWYIDRNDNEKLIDDIVSLNVNKQEQRKP